MWKNILNWLGRFWGVILAISILVGMLAGLTDLIGFYENHWATATPPPTAAPTSPSIPTVSPTPTLGPFQFIALPPQVKAGDDAEVILQARQGDVCHLEYYTPDGSKSSARGLGPVTADSMARCVWQWHVSANTKPGQAKLVISINDIRETHGLEILPGN